jgi:DNA repair protein RecN (Recombination protein N)
VLHELFVENFAVVERARVRFHPGFNLLTGETGSGKSLIVDTLALLFGGRAAAEMVRSGAERARISGIFDPPPLPSHLEIDIPDGELILEREILASGKSRAFANGRPVTAAQLRELAPLLGDIHGQHDQQRLFEEAAQREILDSFGECDVAAVEKVYREWTSAKAELAALESEERERLRLADLWAFQKKEIEAAAIHSGEDAALEAEKRMLANVTKLSQAAGEAYSALYEAPESTLTTLRAAIRRGEELTRLDASLGPALEAMRQAEIALQEAAFGLRDYLDRLEADPARLDEVETRLAALDKLKRKYGGTLEAVLAHLEQVTASLNAAETAADRAARLRRQVEALAAEYEKAAGALTARRREAAEKLERAVAAELKPLAMARAKFIVSLAPGPPAAHGADTVRFLISPNLGEEPRPLDRVLSGGELSRLALALKCITSSGPAARTLVFDEVDAGIGGAVAEAVGKRLKRIAKDNQVLCVTHLAQIAGYGDHHYAVEKREAHGRTIATIGELDRGQRIRELGRMLAGERITPEALRHAEKLLVSAPEP